MTTSDKVRERVHWIAEEASQGNWQSFEDRLAELILDYESRMQDLVQSTPRSHDIAALIQEMRYGFEQMDKRFNLIEKRFEQMDKRFADLIHQMDKRFEQVDKRFRMVLWILGIGFSFLSCIITYGTFFKN